MAVLYGAIQHNAENAGQKVGSHGGFRLASAENAMKNLCLQMDSIAFVSRAGNENTHAAYAEAHLSAEHAGNAARRLSLDM